MRTILFRGKRVDNGQWVEGDLIQECVYIEKLDKIEDVFSIKKSDCFADKVIDTTIGQFIGIFDRDRNKIFEGDVVKIGQSIMCEICYVEENETHEGDEIHAGFHLKFKKSNKLIPIDTYAIGLIRVVGNIYDNPELLDN